MKLFDEYCARYVLPEYAGRTDYNTNAPSYYDHLAKINAILKIMAKMVDKQNDILEDYIIKLDDELSKVDGFVIASLEKWIADGTIDALIQQYINDGVLSGKVDTVDFDTFKSSFLTLMEGVNEQLTTQQQQITKNKNDIGGLVGNTSFLELQQQVNNNQNDLINRLESKFVDITKPPYNVPTDKITDCSPMIQKALDEVPIRGTIYLPKGTYVCKKPLEFTRELTFVGQQAGENGGTTIRADFGAEYTNQILFHLHTTAKNSNISNLYLGVKASSASCHGIGNGGDGQQAITHLNIENVWVVGFSSGFWFDKWYLSRFRNCYAVGNYYGFHLQGEATSIIFDGCYANDNKDNFRITSLLYSSFISCGSDGAERYGYYFKKAKGVTLNGCGVETAGHTGMYFDTENESVVLNAPFAVGCGETNPNLASFIHIEGQNKGISILSPFEYAAVPGAEQSSSIAIGRTSQVSIQNPNVRLKIPLLNAGTVLDGQRRSETAPKVADGSFTIGDFVWNGGTERTILGWTCTASGTPGTWLPVTVTV